MSATQLGARDVGRSEDLKWFKCPDGVSLRFKCGYICVFVKHGENNKRQKKKAKKKAYFFPIMSTMN